VSREAMASAARLANGTIIPAMAIYCTNRFAHPAGRLYRVREPWLPADKAAVCFTSREAALQAILDHDARRQS